VSWDVLIMKVPAGVKKMEDLPPEFDHVLCALTELPDRLRSVFPEIDLTDPTWGDLEGADYSIEFNIGKEDPCEAIMLHVRGGQGAFEPIRKLCTLTGWAALDDGEFIDFSADDAAKGFNAWRDYRDRVIPGAPEKGVRMVVPVKSGGEEQ
jgi:hypothetical protein